MYDVMRNVGFFVQFGETIGFMRWFRIDLDVGLAPKSAFRSSLGGGDRARAALAVQLDRDEENGNRDQHQICRIRERLAHLMHLIDVSPKNHARYTRLGTESKAASAS